MTKQILAFDVLVAGAGVVGLSAAIAMAKLGYSVAIIERNVLAAKNNSSRVYAINLASQNFFESIGVWAQIQPAATPYQKMHVWDAKTTAALDFNANDVGQLCLGWIVEESVIVAALLKQARLISTIEYFEKQEIDAITRVGKKTQIENRDYIFESNLLMIADGAQSTCRDKLSIPVVSWPYGQVAIVCQVETTKSHQSTAYQVFLPNGPLAFLPLTSPQSCSIVCSTTPAEASVLLEMNNAAFGEWLTQHFSEILGKCTIASERQQFPLVMRHTKQYAQEGWILMGDSAHTIHPMAGLGLNIGLADLMTWLSLIDERNGCKWSHKTFAQYNRQRKYSVWQMIGLLEGLGYLFAFQQSTFIKFRKWGINACQQMTPLKSWLIEQALYLDQKPIDRPVEFK